MRMTLAELLHTVDTSELELRDLIAAFAAGCLWAEGSWWDVGQVAERAYEMADAAMHGRGNVRLNEHELKRRFAALLSARNGRV